MRSASAATRGARDATSWHLMCVGCRTPPRRANDETPMALLRGSGTRRHHRSSVICAIDSGQREDRAPEWSPDGATIVFMSQFNDPCCDPWQIWSVGRDGSNPMLLSDNPAVNDVVPSFSPDDRSIVPHDALLSGAA